MTKKRKSPIRHVVSSYIRNGKKVHSYTRGKGNYIKRYGKGAGGDSYAVYETKPAKPTITKYQSWDKAFERFQSKFDKEIIKTFGQDKTWEGIMDSIGRPGAEDLPIDHKEELKFYIKSKKSSPQLKLASKQLLRQFRREM